MIPWRTLHNATALLVVLALATAIPLAFNLPRGLREPWVLAHIVTSLMLVLTVPVQILGGFKRLLRLRHRDGMRWLNGWFGRLLLPLVIGTVLSGVALWRMDAPGGPTWPTLAHRLTWQILVPTLVSHIVLSGWLRRRRRRR